jgi:hypothetical protein
MFTPAGCAAARGGQPDEAAGENLSPAGATIYNDHALRDLGQIAKIPFRDLALKLS